MEIQTESVESHTSGSKTIPSNFFEQPRAEHISAVIFTNSGTHAKFTRMGFQQGFGNDHFEVIRRGFSYTPDPDAKDATFFSYCLSQPPLVKQGDIMRITIRATISAIAVGTLLAATTLRADAQVRNDRVRVDTLESGRIVVSNPDSPQAGPQGVPALVEVLRIGSIEGTCDAFGQVFSLAVDGDGRIYVADRQANEIRVFTPRVIV